MIRDEIKEKYKDLIEDERVKRVCQWHSPISLGEELTYDSAKYLERASRNAFAFREKLDEIFKGDSHKPLSHI